MQLIFCEKYPVRQTCLVLYKEETPFNDKVGANFDALYSKSVKSVKNIFKFTSLTFYLSGWESLDHI